MTPTVLHVVAGVLTGADGRVLIAQRPPGKHLAGGWEFPGGKRDDDEPREAALARERAGDIVRRVPSAAGGRGGRRPRRALPRLRRLDPTVAGDR
jgi:hypothetical protein